MAEIVNFLINPNENTLAKMFEAAKGYQEVWQHSLSKNMERQFAEVTAKYIAEQILVKEKLKLYEGC